MGEAKIKQRVHSKLVAEISQAELACRIYERVAGIAIGVRPYPTSPEKSMAFLRETDPEIHGRIVAAAATAVEYIAECINKGSVPS